MFRKLAVAGGCSAGAAAFYFKPSPPEGPPVWTYNEEFLSVHSRKGGTAVACRQPPAGLSSARYSLPMSQGVWRWELQCSGDIETEVGVCGVDAPLEHTMKRLRGDHETWRTVSRDWMYVASSLVRVDPVPNHLIFELNLATHKLRITSPEDAGFRMQMSVPKKTALHLVARFHRSPASVLVIAPPTRIDAVEA